MITLPPIKKRKRYLGSILRHLTTYGWSFIILYRWIGRAYVNGGLT